MNITNNHNLPQAIVDAIRWKQYSRPDHWDFSCSELTGPAYKWALSRSTDISTRDAMDMVWALWGTANHYIIESAARVAIDEGRNVQTEWIAERVLNGFTIGGHVDYIDHDNKIIYDWKTAGAYTLTKDNREWREQLNIYRWLLNLEDYAMANIVIVRDWTRDRDWETKT